MSDSYELVARGKLKLKTDTESSKNKKKRKKDKKKERERLDRGVRQEQETYDEEQRIAAAPKIQQMTKAELSFKKMQEKMVNNNDEIYILRKHLSHISIFALQQEKRIMEKAAMTHKQKVEKFNEHLDSLTEHFDIPKVSWTK